MKKKHLQFSFLFLITHFIPCVINSQTIDYTVNGSLCAGTHILTLSGTSNGKNTYTGTIAGNAATIAWSGTQWQINTPFGVQFTNTAQTAIDPPCHSVGTFVAAGFCLGATVTNSSGACATAVIPVELIDFTVRVSAASIELNWLTASEINNKGFQVERSENGADFYAIDFVKTKGNSNGLTAYKLVDKTAYLSVNYYYRLKQIDTNGKEKLSKIISIKTTNKNTFSFSPNPANTALIINSQNEKSVFRVYDVLGKLVLTTVVADNNRAFTMDISALNSGNYILEMTTINGVSFREKLVKF